MTNFKRGRGGCIGSDTETTEAAWCVGWEGRVSNRIAGTGGAIMKKLVVNQSSYIIKKIEDRESWPFGVMCRSGVPTFIILRSRESRTGCRCNLTFDA